MDTSLFDSVSNLIGRLDVLFSFRFLLQPVMALIYATRDGFADAREGRPPSFWTMFARPEERWRLLREGGQSVARVLVLGVVMDTAYQLIVFRWIYPSELIVITLGLAFIPYVLLRGPVGRIATWWTGRGVHAKPGLSGRETDNARRRNDRAGRGRFA